MERSRTARCIRAGLAAVLLLAAAIRFGSVASAAAFDRSEVVSRDGNPTLVVDGKPFFFYGAAFFYERIPAANWRASMLALRTLGFNTLDLYVPWNWHEIADGEFDFDGHTNERRNLRGVLALARELQFKLVVRPGPVIRNEWRNGGYPSWLLTRPEYGMPLHDVLEGRYPATATLQNANSDDAAAQWMANATHMRYAARWLRTALREFVPYGDLVLAVQLDDDQGAYIDNQTWPAPHLQTYLRTLEGVVRETVGARLPVFINTYEMKVTASSPVWAMGNWYQSDAYSIGEHDRAALEFSTGLLQTQVRVPVAMSEFQAGWLAPPEDPQPRPADPTNTTLALHTLLGMGTRGVIDFPAQDTVNPAGWEAPFANADYAWDAALGVDLAPSERYAPTARFGALVREYGTELASARRVADGAVAYLTSAYDEHAVTNADVFAIAARTQEAQQRCRAYNLACDLVDLRFASDSRLQSYPFVVVPQDDVKLAFTPNVRAALTRYRRHGGRVLSAPPDVVSPHAGGLADATLLAAADGAAFLDIVNYDAHARAIPATQIALPTGRHWNIAPFTLAARDAVLLRYAATPAVNASPIPAMPAVGGLEAAATPAPRPCQTAVAFVPDHAPPFGPTRIIEDDRAQDGFGRVTLTNDHAAVTVAPAAGARAFAFEAAIPGGCALINVFTSVGALRDDADLQPPLSTTDRIGKYTRTFPAGMFNRTYAVAPAEPGGTASVTFTYDAPDVVPNGARFTRTLTMTDAQVGFTVRERADFGAAPAAAAQRAVRYDSFDTRNAAILDEHDRGRVGFFYPAIGRVAIVAWRHAGVEAAELRPQRTSMVVRLRFAPGESVTRYALTGAADINAARAALGRESASVEAER